MLSGNRFDKLLLLIPPCLLLWFFASNLTTAFNMPPLRDDAMFVGVPKNFLNGYGWATSYGEKIPFNPDLTAGPSLLLPAGAIIALFGPQTWTAAITGTLLNIIFCLLVLWQLTQQVQNRSAHTWALLLCISLYAVHDFSNFTGYYPCALSFVFSLLFISNKNYKSSTRLLAYGLLAALGALAKPLIFLSFLLAAPWVIYRCASHNSATLTLKKLFSSSMLALAGFMLVFSSWQIYKVSTLSHYDTKFQQAHERYTQHFFDHHGSGIAQFKAAPDKLIYLKKNTAKNWRILRNHLKRAYGIPLVFFFGCPLLLLLLSVIFKKPALPEMESKFSALLVWVMIGNYVWFLVFAFAMTPGHAFFAVFYNIFLWFFLLAALFRSALIGIALCLMASGIFYVRYPSLLNAYRFDNRDPYISNEQINAARDFITTQPLNYPLASCGYNGAPWRLEFLLPGSQNFLDCYNVLEDRLVLDQQAYRRDNPGILLTNGISAISPVEHFWTQGLHRQVNAQFSWSSLPELTIVVELFGLMGATKPQAYILEPLFDECFKNVLFRNESFIICEVRFTLLRDQLDPTETARHLVDYQHWYRTRLKTWP